MSVIKDHEREWRYLKKLNQDDHGHAAVAGEIHRQDRRDDDTDVEKEEDPARSDEEAPNRRKEPADSKHRMANRLVINRVNTRAGAVISSGRWNHANTRTCVSTWRRSGETQQRPPLVLRHSRIAKKHPSPR